MIFEPNEEQKEFLTNFRSFCEKEIGPKNVEVEKAGELPKSHFQKLGKIGFTGLLHKEAFGGSDSGFVLATLAQEILAEYCGSTFFSVGASAGLFGLTISDHGTEEQKKKFLPPILSGEKIGALAITEPGAGTDVSSITTSALYKNAEYLLSGQKTFITNAPVCDWAVVLANVIDEVGKKTGPTCFLVDMSLSGVGRGKPMEKLGLHGSPTGEIFLDSVKLPASSVIGKPGKGFKMIMEAFNRERLALGAYSCGVMAACLGDSRKYAKIRKSFGRPISKHQSVAFMLASMLTKYDAAKIVLHEAAWMMDEYMDKKPGEKPTHNGYPVDLTAKTATVKLLASTYAREVANMAVQIHGGSGYMQETRVSRLYRDIKLAEIGGGTSEIMKQIIAHSESKRVR